VILLLAVPALADDLPRVIPITVPAPIAGLDDQGDEVCVSMKPSLRTEDVELGYGDYGARCTSDADETRACLTVSAGATWPKRFPLLVCQGPAHTLNVTFVRGYDPFDDPADGVSLVRMVGPDALQKDQYARFAVAGWPDAVGILRDGQCSVKDGVLTVFFRQDDNLGRTTCTLVTDQASGAERAVEIRLVDRLR
jgi:hypothetical protein